MVRIDEPKSRGRFCIAQLQYQKIRIAERACNRIAYFWRLEELWAEKGANGKEHKSSDLDILAR